MEGKTWRTASFSANLTIVVSSFRKIRGSLYIYIYVTYQKKLEKNITQKLFLFCTSLRKHPVYAHDYQVAYSVSFRAIKAADCSY